MLVTELVKWCFINAMVATGMAFLAAYPRWIPQLKDTLAFPWRSTAAAGLTGLFCMFFPLTVGPGMQWDIRLLPVGLVAWEHGWKAYLGGALPLLAIRFWMGGRGAWLAIIATTVYLGVVLLFRGRPRTPWNLTGMGVGYAFAAYVTFLPVRLPGLEPTNPNWLFLTAIYTLSTWLLNGVQQHVAAKQELEQALAVELRNKAAVLELIPYGVVLQDVRGRVTDANEAARDLMHGDELPSAIRAHPGVWHAVNEGDRTQGHLVEFADDNGAPRHVLVSVTPLGAGAIIGLKNVTSVVLQEREEAGRVRLELLGQLSAMAAHEIKNPLTTIKGFLQLMEVDPLFARHQATFSLLQGEVNHINRVVSDFLVLSGRSSQEMVAASVDELLGTICKVAELQHPSNMVTVTWEGQAGISVHVDEKSLTQILKNLVANAYEAMPDGGELRLMRERVGEMVRIAVIDSGPGIAPDVLSHIFRPYMTTKSTGTGLGLAISHKLATEMGGTLEVSSVQGRGSTFNLVIPRQRLNPAIPEAFVPPIPEAQGAR